jgi:hypothetical protein
MGGKNTNAFHHVISTKKDGHVALKCKYQEVFNLNLYGGYRQVWLSLHGSSLLLAVATHSVISSGGALVMSSHLGECTLACLTVCTIVRIIICFL